FKITGLADGDYTLRASRTGNLRGGRNRGPGAGITAHTGDDKVKIVLLAEGAVTGKVTQTDGSAPPVFTAQVGSVQQSFVGGDFSLAGFGDGDLTIVADLPGVGRSKALRVTADAPNQTALSLELLQYGAISGSLTQGGQPAAGVMATAQSTSTPGAVYTVQAGRDGAYRFDQLAPDTYKVSAMLGTPRRGMHLYSQQVTIAPGAEAH